MEKITFCIDCRKTGNKYAFVDNNAVCPICSGKLIELTKLQLIDKLWRNEEIETILKECTIFDKIEFSGISKETIQTKINDLETRQVPNRDVLLNMIDYDVTDYWFKNWLHSMLKHAVTIHGVGGELNAKRAFLRNYENGQQNFDYTLEDIKNWLKGE